MERAAREQRFLLLPKGRWNCLLGKAQYWELLPTPPPRAPDSQLGRSVTLTSKQGIHNLEEAQKVPPSRLLRPSGLSLPPPPPLKP